MKLFRRLLATSLFIVIAPITFACEVDNGKKTSAGNITLSYKILSESLTVSQPFSIEIKLCEMGEPMVPKQLKVNAEMPAHGHGMNYQPTIKPLDQGHYQVDNFVFHMMGNWVLTIDVFTKNEKQSFAIDYKL